MDGHGDWVLLAIIGIALLAVLVYTLFRMSGDQDREARHAEKELIPHSDVTITTHKS
jgi:flagellar basal body-associated protein FliL